MIRLPALLLLLATLPAAASGDEAPAAVRVPAGTELVFEMLDSVDSKSNQRGDRFRLRLAEPLVLDGQPLVDAGAPAVGEVVHADRARAGGQAGELILAVRELQAGERTVALRGFRTDVGRDRTRSAVGVAVAAGVAGFLVRGGQAVMPAGARVAARTRDEVFLTPRPEAAAPSLPTRNDP